MRNQQKELDIEDVRRRLEALPLPRIGAISEISPGIFAVEFARNLAPVEIATLKDSRFSVRDGFGEEADYRLEYVGK